MKVKLSSGTFSGGVVLYVLTTTAYTFAGSGWTLLLTNQWREITLDLRKIPGADQVIGFGVQFGTGAPFVIGDGGSGFPPTTPVFNVDTFVD